MHQARWTTIRLRFVQSGDLGPILKLHINMHLVRPLSPLFWLVLLMIEPLALKFRDKYCQVQDPSGAWTPARPVRSASPVQPGRPEARPPGLEAYPSDPGATDHLWADFPENWSWGFQDPASPWMYAIIDLHDRIMFYLIILLIVVVWFLVSATLTPAANSMNFHHGNLIELIWTLTPAGILWAIGLPSLKLLYMIDEILDAEITIKAIANQWYWSYEYSDYRDSLDKSIAFDSFMVSDDSLEEGDLRQLAVDNYLVLPINTSIRLLVTSNDVIHSFAIPS